LAPDCHGAFGLSEITAQPPHHWSLALATCLLCAIIGAMLVGVGTRGGIGLTADSAVYLGAARCWAAGEGLVVPFGAATPTPLTHYPPVYPAGLALVEGLGGDPLVATRCVNLLLLMAVAVICGMIVWRGTRSAMWASGAALLAASGPVTMFNFSMLWTEPPFFLLTLIGAIALAYYVVRPGWSLLLVAALAFSCATLTRYAGLGIVAGGFLVLCLLGNRGLRSRIVAVAVYCAITLLPLVAWFVRNHFVSTSAADRTLAWHPISVNDLLQAAFHISTWALPLDISSLARWIIGAAMATAFVGLCVVGFRAANRNSTRGETVDAVLRVFLILMLSYVAFLIAVKWFWDAPIPLDNRMLAPFYYLALPVGVTLIARLVRDRPFTVRTIVWVLVVLLAASYMARGIAWTRRAPKAGLGYASESWRQSLTVSAMQLLPREFPRMRMVTNGADALYAVGGLRAEWLPEKYSFISRLPNTTCAEQLRAACSGHPGRPTFVVYFNELRERTYFPEERDFPGDIGLILFMRLPDGVVYLTRSSIESAD
jgi:hypothetical protein